MLYLEILAGLALLLVGGDALVRGAVALAGVLGVSPFLIGITIVGFGTSAPELVTSLEAALIGSPGIAVGNVVGSNIANVLLILGLTALLAPVAVSRQAFLRDGAMLLLASLACLAVVLLGSLERLAGLLFIAVLLLYLLQAYHRDRRAQRAAGCPQGAVAHPAPARRRLWLAAGLTLAGLALTLVGAKLLVGGAVALASAAGVSQTLIGLTLVAVGTSLPELSTSVVAALRRQGDVALGNVVGSNIFNVLAILGITAVVRPVPVPAEIVELDVWVMLTATLALAVFAVSGWRLCRAEGAVLLAGYCAYLGVLAATSL